LIVEKDVSYSQSINKSIQSIAKAAQSLRVIPKISMIALVTDCTPRLRFLQRTTFAADPAVRDHKRSSKTKAVAVVVAVVEAIIIIDMVVCLCSFALVLCVCDDRASSTSRSAFCRAARKRSGQDLLDTRL